MWSTGNQPKYFNEVKKNSLTSGRFEPRNHVFAILRSWYMMKFLSSCVLLNFSSLVSFIKKKSENFTNLISQQASLHESQKLVTTRNHKELKLTDQFKAVLLYLS